MVEVTLLGKGTLAIRIGEWFRASPEFELVEVIPVVPEPAWSDSLAAWARDHDVHVVETGDYRDHPGAADGPRTGLAVSVFYDRIVRPSFIQRCDRILNLHNGPLPRYRGVAPINWAL